MFVITSYSIHYTKLYDNPFVNAKNLFKSGQLHWCKERHEEKGKIEIDDFKECVRLYNQLEHNYLMLMKLYFDFYDIKT